MDKKCILNFIMYIIYKNNNKISKLFNFLYISKVKFMKIIYWDLEKSLNIKTHW